MDLRECQHHELIRAALDGNAERDEREPDGSVAEGVAPSPAVRAKTERPHGDPMKSKRRRTPTSSVAQ